MLRRLAVVTLALALAGCPAQKVYRSGVELEEQGRLYQAAEHYLAALDRNPKHRGARGALAAVAEPAYERKLNQAEKAESARDWPRALGEYQELERYLAHLGAYGFDRFPAIDPRPKIEQMSSAAAQERYAAAEQHYAARRWEAAIADYRAAQGFRPGYQDSDAKIVLASFSWAEDEVAARRWRSAAELFEAAASHKDAQARANGLWAALGRWHLAERHCRQAVRDLRAAAARTGDDAVARDLDKAVACATTRVGVIPFSNPTGTSVAGLAIGDLLSDTTVARLVEGTGEFVKVYDRDSLLALLMGQGLGWDTAGRGTKGVDWLVVGRLTQVHAPRPEVEAVAKQTGGTWSRPCADGSGTCAEDVLVDYVQRAAHSSVRLAGTAKVLRVADGEVVATIPYDGVSEDTAVWADQFSVAGRAVVPGSGLTVPSDVLALAQADRALAPDEDLVRALIADFAAAAATSAAAVVDAEPQISDPSALTWRPLP